MVSTNLKLQHTRYGPSYSLCCKVVEMSFCNPFSPSSVSFQPNLLFLPQDLYKFSSPFSSSSCSCSSSCTTTATTTNTTRRAFSLLTATSSLIFSPSFTRSSDASAVSDFFELENSGGVKALDLREGEGEVPVIGDQVAIHYYGRLAAKQGWRFDSTYDHKDEMGDTVPFIFVVGSGKVISGIEAAVKSMKVGGIRRVIIPPSQGYQNTSQEPIPPNVRVGIKGLRSSLQLLKKRAY
ncbi:peptidyl-prolyl cis-trans isomerase FKBP17-1, chloroplastic-like isoform X2 [Magnolia sinica]|uniref:peptidyl-prolyl cis-trans isomerase FKBP17-1, chloroplastic-like isoform X2 n=1 Tax=Magnolia sinica TaxID=86752 RepID=UPI00265939CE|nr:peptidyl-prolyl cis-trans isomerase FKBP17-1, chloroplastic-like isoform X2 [Magnolia sinica]